MSSNAAAFGGDETKVGAPASNPYVVASLCVGPVGGGVKTAATVLSCSPAQFEHWPDEEIFLPQIGQTIWIQTIAGAYLNTSLITDRDKSTAASASHNDDLEKIERPKRSFASSLGIASR